MKTIKLNGEFTIEQLEQKIKGAKEPVWTIEKDDSGFGHNGEKVFHYYLMKNGEREKRIWTTATKSFQENYSQLIYKIANTMGVLATKEEILNEYTYSLYYSHKTKKFTYTYNKSVCQSTHIKDYESFHLVLNTIENSPLMKEFE